MNREKILIVDDRKENIKILLGLLDNYELLVAINGDSAIRAAQKESVDLILLDILMPGIDGYETCRRLKADEKTSPIPIIFITAKSDEESIEKAFEVGGVDYVTKPFKPGELRARVRTHLELRSLINHLDYISSHDQMTGVYNRRKFFELGTLSLTGASTNLYIMMLDIDKFKDVNDRYGHSTGDRVIQAAAGIIKSSMDGTDAVVARIGGEEFAVLFHIESREKAFFFIEQIRSAVEDIKLAADDGTFFNITISGGLANWDNSIRKIDVFLKKADNALYESKGTGRNRSIFRE